MGAGSSARRDRPSAADERRRTAALDVLLERRGRARAEAELTVLVLGPPRSGKTTFLRQLRALKGRDDIALTPSESAPFLPLVHAEAHSAMTRLLHEASLQRTRIVLEAARDVVMGHPRGELLTPAVAEAAGELWRQERGLERAWDRRRYALHDNTAYLVRRMAAIAAPSYLPTREDVLRCHDPTLAVRDMSFKLGAADARFIEVAPGLSATTGAIRSGGRLPYHKWLDVFSMSNGILFVVALSDYDSVGEGGGDNGEPPLNKLAIALEHWRRILALLSNTSSQTLLVCLLTKRDLFMDKIKTTPLRHAGGHDTAPRYMDYSDGSDPVLALQYVEKLFASANVSNRPNVVVETCSLLDLVQKNDTRHQRGQSLTLLIEALLDRTLRIHQALIDEAERVA